MNSSPDQTVRGPDQAVRGLGGPFGSMTPRFGHRPRPRAGPPGPGPRAAPVNNAEPDRPIPVPRSPVRGGGEYLGEQ
ncbi:hypothetical protein GCM10010389_16050 [Streptomyces echinoruber]|uniref:Uncharacterized protein n=1 Tax=Streptomyces echinoruber TaxID=68898 RepID=A0A918R0M8_9ACTN|nr:hypothetical protein GCM10010389_16050 [Streptomyces echinoruber]